MTSSMHTCGLDHPLPEVVDGEVSLPVIVSLSINTPQNLTKHSHSTSHIVTTHKNGAVRVASWNLAEDKVHKCK